MFWSSNCLEPCFNAFNVCGGNRLSLNLEIVLSHEGSTLTLALVAQLIPGYCARMNKTMFQNHKKGDAFNSSGTFIIRIKDAWSVLQKGLSMFTIGCVKFDLRTY